MCGLLGPIDPAEPYSIYAAVRHGPNLEWSHKPNGKIVKLPASLAAGENVSKQHHWVMDTGSDVHVMVGNSNKQASGSNLAIFYSTKLQGKKQQNDSSAADSTTTDDSMLQGDDANSQDGSPHLQAVSASGHV